MHIPEGFLSPYFSIGLTLVTIALLIPAIKKHILNFPKNKLVALALVGTASFVCSIPAMPVFCAVPMSVSLCVLIAVLFGPWTGFLANSIILLVQAVLFGDGGISTLGANCFNIAFLQSFIGYGIYYAITRISKKVCAEVIGIMLGSFIAYFISSVFIGFEVGSQQLFFHDSSGHGLYAPFSLPTTLISILECAGGIWGLIQAVFSGIALAFCRKKVTALSRYYTSEKPFTVSDYKKVLICLIIGIILLPFIRLALVGVYGEYSASFVEHNAGYLPASLANPLCYLGVFPQYHIAALPAALSFLACSIIGSAACFGALLLLHFLPTHSTDISTKKDNPTSSKDRVVYDEYNYEVDV